MDNQNIVDAFGYAGAVFLTLLTFPQVYYCFKNKTSKGLTVFIFIFRIYDKYLFCLLRNSFTQSSSYNCKYISFNWYNFINNCKNSL